MSFRKVVTPIAFMSALWMVPACGDSDGDSGNGGGAEAGDGGASSGSSGASGKGGSQATGGKATGGSAGASGSTNGGSSGKGGTTGGGAGKGGTGQGGGDGGVGALAGEGGAGGSGATGTSCDACQANQGCVVVHVSRAADESNSPWVNFPSDADGQGTFTVPAGIDGGQPTTRARVPDVDLTDDNIMLDVELGCFDDGAVVLVCPYLDDDDMQVGQCSSNVLDTCPVGQRQSSVTVEAGMTSRINVQMGLTCD